MHDISPTIGARNLCRFLYKFLERVTGYNWLYPVVMIFVRLCDRAADKDSDVRRLVQCGTERCLLQRTLDSFELLLRCLEERCAAALPRRSGAGGASKDGTKTSGDCAAACNGVVQGAEYLECLSQSCGIMNQPPAASSFCPSVCYIISPDNVNRCLERYCPADGDQDQGREREQYISWTKNIKRWAKKEQLETEQVQCYRLWCMAKNTEKRRQTVLTQGHGPRTLDEGNRCEERWRQGNTYR